MHVIGNFDADGALIKLHLDPVEECNLDDAKDIRTLPWPVAFCEVASIWCDKPNILVILCAHCGFRKEEA